MMTVRLADEKCHLALSDKVKGSTHLMDVANEDQVFQFAKDAAQEHGGVDIIINNAGVSLGDFLETVSLNDFRWLFDIDFWGTVYGTMAFLPYLRKRPEGHIVNISSINGILPNPNNGPYCAAKFAVKGYTETLYQELRESSIGVSCVHPGGIKTNIARNAKVKNTIANINGEQAAELYDKELFIKSADDAARIIIKGIKKNQRRVLIGRDAKAMDFLTRMLPRTAVWLSAVIAKRLAHKYAK